MCDNNKIDNSFFMSMHAYVTDFYDAFCYNLNFSVLFLLFIIIQYLLVPV